MKTSPTQRTLKYLRDRGWCARKVEYWQAFAKKRIDLWTADIIAVHPSIPYPILVQCTSAANTSSRQRKAEETPEVKLWLRFGAFMVQGWKKRVGGWDFVNYHAFYDKDTGKISWEVDKAV